jgi:hypothetical protein
MEGTPPANRLAINFRGWSITAERREAPLTAHVLACVAEDLAAGGVMGLVLRPYLDEPDWRELPLRLLARVHRRVLRGELPELATYYPSVGGSRAPSGVWPRFCRACVEGAQDLQRGLAEPACADDVGRVPALISGFRMVARETSLPLRLLQIGAGAGLELRWDHLEGGLNSGVEVVERRGCDPAPLDPVSEEGALTLRSYCWPDQVDRRRMLDDALDACGRIPAHVDQAEPGAWLVERLAEPFPSSAAVVFRAGGSLHPAGALARAARAATAQAPLAWLRLEPGRRGFDVRLTVWPSGEDRVLASTDWDGGPVTSRLTV